MAERANETGEPDAAIWYVNLMGFTHRQAGRYDEALALFEAVMEMDGDVSPIAGDASGTQQLGCSFVDLEASVSRALQVYVDQTQKRRRLLKLDT